MWSALAKAGAFCFWNGALTQANEEVILGLVPRISVLTAKELEVFRTGPNRDSRHKAENDSQGDFSGIWRCWFNPVQK